MQHYAGGFESGNKVLRPDEAIGRSESVEIAETWRGPTRQPVTRGLTIW